MWIIKRFVSGFKKKVERELDFLDFNVCEIQGAKKASEKYLTINSNHI